MACTKVNPLHSTCLDYSTELQVGTCLCSLTCYEAQGYKDALPHQLVNMGS